MNQGGSGTVSRNPMDYLAFVVYVKPTNPICSKLMAKCAGFDDVKFENVDTGNRPHWLTGVPTAVCLKDNKIYEGSWACHVLEKHTNVPKDFSSISGNGYTYQGGNLAGNSSIGTFDPLIDDADKYGTGKLKDDSVVSRYMKIREQSGKIQRTGAELPPAITDDGPPPSQEDVTQFTQRRTARMPPKTGSIPTWTRQEGLLEMETM